MRVAPEGWPFIIIAWAIEIALIIFAPLIAPILWAVVAIWVVAFFRDPQRDGPRGDNLIIAPADGKIVSIIDIDEPKVIGGASRRISIFMNVFNVHVNRYPISGRISFREYHKGKFHNADDDKAALENEHSDIGLTNAHGSMLARQIAGSVARRIVTDHDAGREVQQGERLGLIRFGSRVDVFVPPTARILVKVGEITQAGITVLAEWK